MAAAHTQTHTHTQTQTHTHMHASTGCPVLLKSSAFKQEGMKKAPPPTPPRRFTLQDYQTSRQPRQPQLSSNRFTSNPISPRAFFSENVISHSGPGLKFEAAHQDYLRISTLCVC